MTLFIYISLNSFLICVLAYCIYIITATPKLTTPQLMLYLGMKPKKFFRRDTFYRLNYVFYRHHRYTLYQKMNVIFIRSYFNEKYFKSAFNIFTHFHQTIFNRLRQNTSPVFYRTYQMVQQQILIMTLMNMITHKTNITLTLLTQPRSKASRNSFD